MNTEEIIKLEGEAILNMPKDNPYYSAALLIYDIVHVKGGRVIISGMGKAGQIALNIATTLSSTGTPAIFLHPADAQHGDIGVIRAEDILIIVSNSGKTREIIELCYSVLNLHSHIPLILITGNLNTELRGRALYVLWTGNPPEACPFGMTPTTSTTVIGVIGDIIVNLMMDMITFTREEYYKRHHGGYIGNKLNHKLKKNG